MTTGNITVTPPAVGTSCGSGRPGWHRWKQWSGSNTTTNKIKPQYEVRTYERPGFWAFAPKGQKVWIPARPPIFKRRRIWVRAPRRIRTQENPYSCQWRYTNDPLTQWFTGYTTMTGTSGPCGYAIVEGASDPWGSNETIALLGKLREKVAGSDWNAGVFLSELPMAARMIADIAFKIDSAYRQARRGNFKKAAAILVKNSKRTPPKIYAVPGTELAIQRKKGLNPKKVTADKVTASNWLELQYGWLPLLQDVSNAAQFIAHQTEYPFQYVARCSMRKAGDASGIRTSSPSLFGVTEVDNYARRSIKALLREKDVVALTGLLDPLSVIWERLPYSFVIDWFIPIGNYLQARGLAQALSGTFVVSHKWEMKVTGLYVKPPYSKGKNFELFSHSRGTFSRTVSTSLQVPLPEVKPLSSVPSWKRAANAVSLLLQRRGRPADDTPTGFFSTHRSN